MRPMCLHKSTEGVPLTPSCLCLPVCCHCRPAHTVAVFLSIHTTPVSYTHLDVYKRQHFFRPQSARTWDYSGTDNQKDTLSREASGSYSGQEFSLYAEDDIACLLYTSSLVSNLAVFQFSFPHYSHFPFFITLS